MTDEVLIPIPALALHIGGDPDGGTAVIGVETKDGDFAVTITLDQLSIFAGQIIDWAGQAQLPARVQSTHAGPLSGHPIPVKQVGLVDPGDDRTVILGFPVGGLTLTFQVSTNGIASVIARHLAGQTSAGKPAVN